MTDPDFKKISKFLSYVLRHNPAEIGLSLDGEGWAFTDDLLQRAPTELALDKAVLEAVVASSDKKRFRLSDDGSMIRASQGHSIKIDLKLEPAVPPATLYHGTASRFMESISAQGLVKGQRHHVHLSKDKDTARAVGQRHGKVVILSIDSKRMVDDGFTFFLSDNGVWLTDHVPAAYFDIC